ncbi:MAG: hypothetical protein J0M17_18450 [Planctomycetes bacterium]|nr:hypothetical protein [Planctomycetota bacterium]
MSLRLPAVLITVGCLGVACSTLPAAESPSSTALMKLLKSDRLPATRRPAVVELICGRGGPEDLAAMLHSATAGEFDAVLTANVLTLLIDAAEVRKVRPAGDLSSVESLMNADTARGEQAVRAAAVRLAAVWKTPGISESLKIFTADEKENSAVREAAVDGLAALGDAESTRTLEALAKSASTGRLRLKAAAALAKSNLEKAAPVAAAALAHATAQDDVGPVMDAFLIRKGGPDKLADALTAVGISADPAKLALRYMYSVGRSDPQLSDVLSKSAGIAVDQPPPTASELQQLIADVAAHGDAERGERIFRRSDLSCLKCHSIARAGGQVGPELSAIGSISPVDYVANSILQPNLAVKEQFVTRVFITDDGRTITGIVVDRDRNRVNVRDAAGNLVAIPTADIDEEEEGKSLMPQGLTKFLTRDELVDLIKFVSELGKPGPYALRELPTIQRWRLLKNLPAEFAGDVVDASAFGRHVVTAPQTDWLPAYATARGSLPLAELTADGGSLILQGGVNIVTPGELEIRFVPAGAEVWVDAEPVKAPGGTVTLNLTKGTHTLTLRLPPAIKSDGEVRVEVRKSPESSCQFDVVGGA